MEYIRGILNNFWRLTGATKQLAAVGDREGRGGRGWALGRKGPQKTFVCSCGKEKSRKRGEGREYRKEGLGSR